MLTSNKPGLAGISTDFIYSFQKTVRMYPFQIHSIALSTFASLIGPFGGFFASGFKRAFKIKVGKRFSFPLIVS